MIIIVAFGIWFLGAVVIALGVGRAISIADARQRADALATAELTRFDKAA